MKLFEKTKDLVKPPQRCTSCNLGATYDFHCDYGNKHHFDYANSSKKDLELSNLHLNEILEIQLAKPGIKYNGLISSNVKDELLELLNTLE